MATPAAVTYLDHAATTPVRDEVLAAMLPLFSEQFANPSGSHRAARAARRVVDEARDIVAATVGCGAGEVVFTSGGTESDNTVLMGAVSRTGGASVCSAAEHHAVLEVVHRTGGAVVGVASDGSIDLDALERALRELGSVAVVSVMAVNNEVGTVTDLGAVAAVVRRHAPAALLHTDAVQAACWLDLRDVWRHVDAMSLSGHKLGGPKGVGALVLRSGSPFAPLLIGGGQERERRSGTHNVPGIVGLAEALRLTDADRVQETGRIAVLRDRLVDGIVDGLRGVAVVHETVPRDRKVAGSAHVCVEGAENEALLYLLDEAGVCASAASACASGAMEPSHVLAAMGVPRQVSMGAIRMTLGRTTTDADVDRAAEAFVAAVRRLTRTTAP